MKRFIALLAAWAAIAPAPAYAALNVLACEPEWASLVQELAGDRAKVASATTARQDPHRIEARPALLAQARRADLLVCTGAELEALAKDVIAQPKEVIERIKWVLGN